VRELSKPEREKTNTRFNDGKCDPRGRFWVGTLCERAPWNSGALYCLDTDGSIEIKLERIQCSNGLVWSRDEQTFYYIDTSTQEIWGFCYDAEKATLGDKRTVARIPKTIGSPDGMTIDEHDRLWVALWNGGRVICVEPKRGSVEFELPVPAQNVTSVAFGGSELDELYITTASVGLSADERRSQPLAGALFRSRLPFRGLPSRRYLGPICQ
jgi:sugar lactone lactonase YvrE